MQIQRVENNNKNCNFGSRVIKTKRFTNQLSKENKSVQETFSRHIRNLRENGCNDTVLMDYDKNPTFPKRIYNYFLTVFTNDGRIGGRYQSAYAGDIHPHKRNVDIAYAEGKELLKPADEKLVRKYSIRF